MTPITFASVVIVVAVRRAIPSSVIELGNSKGPPTTTTTTNARHLTGTSFARWFVGISGTLIRKLWEVAWPVVGGDARWSMCESSSVFLVIMRRRHACKYPNWSHHISAQAQPTKSRQLISRLIGHSCGGGRRMELNVLCGGERYQEGVHIKGHESCSVLIPLPRVVWLMALVDIEH